MEPSNIHESKDSTHFSFTHLTKVTPVSKYLAAFIFIILPFIGAWVGYQYGVSHKQVSVVTPIVVPEKVATTMPEPVTPSVVEVRPHFELATITPGVEGSEPPTYKIILVDKNGATTLKDSEQGCAMNEGDSVKIGTPFVKNKSVDGVMYDTNDIVSVVGCGWAGWYVAYGLYQASSEYPVTVLVSGGDEVLASETLKVYPK